MAVKDLVQLNTELKEQKERADDVDFKMITFSLGGKDYGVDIMNIKEIAKADKFTYVPNTASYVRGVYNLRGDIIPIVDLRNFFHLPAEERSVENMLILRIDERVYGTIVDRIDKVVGINSASIQPPHPIFGDINIKFISGVVEKEGNLYIILDMVRIFSVGDDDKGKRDTVDSYVEPAAKAESALDFIRQSLPALKHFYPGEINENWLRSRYAAWSTGRAGEALQLKDSREADDFLAGFYSPCSGSFWSEEYAALVKAALPDSASTQINVWNAGCGKGHETYSLACILKERYPDCRIKIWANDNDLLIISQAPNMLFDLEDVPGYCRSYMVRAANGYSFNQEIKDSILFEYHDIRNDNSLPELDVILVRDLLSFLPVESQGTLQAEFGEKLKHKGMIIVGRNEELPESQWRSAARQPLSAYMHP
ncbi:MAG: chemotaxis protein CheW [Treponema sp.]|jgi:purine-binding chemotaxis protein CheW|nr:chemotaxis protein CheW [Treponema sp.]